MVEKDRLNLSKRLKAIYDIVPYQTCIDVGADHGKLIIALIENSKIPNGYAVENKKGPYSILCKEIDKSSKKDLIVPLFSDGINDLTNDVKTIIIAGMGGHLIIDILLKNVDKVKNVNDIILDPHNDVEFVRKKMYEIGFSLKKEIMIFENKVYYEILHFVNEKKDLPNLLELRYGPIFLKEKSNLFIKKYNEKINRIKLILSNDSISIKRRIQLENILKEIEGIL